MTTKFLSGAILSLLALTACGQNSPNAVNRAAKPTATVSATVTPLPEATIKNYDGKGTVTKIDLKIGSVELDHEEIKGLMPKMVMEFYVRDKAQLNDLKLGDKVDFVLEDKGGAERIVDIKKTKAETGK